MLQNAYFLAKIGPDTAKNEQHFAEILPKTGNYPTGPESQVESAAPWPARCSAQQREGIDDVSAVSLWPDETTMLPVPALAQPCNRDRNLQSQLDYERSHDQNAQKNCCYNLNRKSDVRMKLRI